MHKFNAAYALIATFSLSLASASAQDNSEFARKLKYAQEKISEHRYDLAIGTLEELKSQASPRAVYIIDYYMAAAYKDRGDFEKAKAAITTCMQEGGRSNAVLYMAAQIEEALGDVKGAEMLYGQAGGRVVSTSSLKVAVAAVRQNYQLQQADNDHNYHSLGRWDPRRMPLRIYIDAGTGILGYQPAMRQDAINCFNNWAKASDGKLAFTIVSKGAAEGRDLRRDWRGGMRDPGRDIHVHWLPILKVEKDKEPLGVMYPEVTGGKVPTIAYADIYIATNENATGGTYTGPNAVLTDEQKAQHRYQIEAVLLHEVGHSVGLDHSNFRSDLMYPIVFGALASRFEKAPTIGENDKRALAAIYAGASADDPQKLDSTNVTFRPPVNESMVGAYKSAYQQYQTGHYNNAVSYLEKALKTSPNDPMLHSLLASCFLKQHRVAQAKAELQRVIDLAPNTQLSTTAKSLLDVADKAR